tara:strand:+ start:574 stop:1296 length:723 start_codon:yes stop_codon:yes gene_type:complete
MKKTVAIIGSSGAIGNAVSDNLINDESIGIIYKFSRSISVKENKRVKNIFLDIEDEESIKSSLNHVPPDTKFDLVFVATGILHNDKEIFPEKSIKDIDINKLKKVILVNTIGPTLIGKYFIPYLRKDEKSIFAFLSARVGSISENKLGGWYSYRASKTALNQIIKNFSIEIKRSNKNAVFVGLQPGTVKSFLSKPFERNVKEDNLFTPEYSAEKLLQVINDLSPDDSGKFFAWNGEEIQP